MSADQPSVLWIGPHSAPRRSGEVIYDRKISPYLEYQAAVHFFLPHRVGRFERLLRLVQGRTWVNAPYYSAQNIARVRKLAKSADVVVCSWEAFDFLAAFIDLPVVLIAHNVSSEGLRDTLGSKWLGIWMALRSARHEKSLYCRPNVHSIFALSRRDQHLVEQMGVSRSVQWAPPGAPTPAPLSPDAVFDPVLTLSGSYDWHAKKRDLSRFLSDVRGSRLPLASDDPIPDDLDTDLKMDLARFDVPAYCSSRIRIGIIPDRFVMGHKLKAGFYIANNAVVLSYCDICDEFADLPFADRYVRHVTGVDDIERIVAELAALPEAQLRGEFAEFRAAYLNNFTWQSAGERIAQSVLQAARQSR